MPSKGKGPVQVRARRALLVHGTASTTQVMDWTHPPLRFGDDMPAAQLAAPLSRSEPSALAAQRR